jgi:hypothetical protein
MPDIIDFIYRSGDDKGLKKSYDLALADAGRLVAQIKNDALTKAMQAYFNGQIEKSEFLEASKNLNQTPSNVIPFKPTSGPLNLGDDEDLLGGDEDVKSSAAKTLNLGDDEDLLGDSEDNIGNIIDKDVEAAYTPPTLTSEQKKEIQEENAFLDKEFAKLEQLEQEASQPTEDAGE